MIQKKIAFINPPREYWPFINEYDNYMTPLWMVCLAPIAEKLNFHVLCLDCMANKIGWKSLEQKLNDFSPDIIAISESHTLFMPFQFRLIELVSRLKNHPLLIAGGGFYSNQTKELLEQHKRIDLIVIGEGEETFAELLQLFPFDHETLNNLSGLAFRSKQGQIIFTHPRPLIKNLDELPMPAWNYLPMSQYGSSPFLFSPSGVCVFHGRGCICSCDFCSWWTNMAERVHRDGEVFLKPRWRTKSPERTFKELEELVHNYNKNYFVFVDGTWNVDPKWSAQFADLVINSKLKFKWMAFMRADYILRDIDNGVMTKLVDAGLAHILIGFEHSCENILKDDYNKNAQNTDIGKVVTTKLRALFPTLFIQGTFIIGGPNESKATIAHLKNYILKLKLDYSSIHILTPVPGTVIFNKMVKEGKITKIDYPLYDWNTPIHPTNSLTIEELQKEAYYLSKSLLNSKWILRLLFSRTAYKRSMAIWGIVVAIKVALTNFRNIFSLEESMQKMVKPSWFEN